MMMQYKFSGHETFTCRALWLKKGHDYLLEGNNFNDPEAVIKLGVGKNMVGAISFWMKAFNLIDPKENTLTEYANKILNSEKGYDPYLEHDGSLWLLQYLLTSSEYASIYHILFNQFRKEKSEFTTDDFKSFLINLLQKEGFDFNEKSLEKDIRICLKNYAIGKTAKGSIEEDFSNVLIDLNLISTLSRSENGRQFYKINTHDGSKVPSEIFLFCLLDLFKEKTSISLEEIENKLASILAIHKAGLFNKVQTLVSKYPSQIVYTEDGGIKQVQIKGEINKWVILDSYYANK